MSASTRRIVTGLDENGKAVVIFDGPSIAKQNGPVESSVLWVTDETPADNSGTEDTQDRATGIPPPPNGSILRVVSFPPEGRDAGDSIQESHLASSGATAIEDARHPGMHRTDSIDYAIVLAGECDMLVDETEVHVSQGDIIVQRGTNHAWANRGTVPCDIAFILIDAKPV